MVNLQKHKKVICEVSGGVDSSVAAALLKWAGFDVVGVFMKLADNSLFRKSEKQAKKITSILKIPFLSFNLRKEFKKKVIDCFLEECKKGLTPNPCVVCNKEIKFGLLLEKALSINADFIATGHYVRKSKVKNQKSKVIYKLLKAKDKNKDQSYFLWCLNQKQLGKILFPIGNYTKSEVRNLARKFKLPTAEAKESQEICFIKTTINDFLKKHIKPKAGKIIDKEGRVLSTHEGLFFYTIGQRKGIKLPGGPFYVLNKDLKRNLLIVTKNEKDLYKKELIAKNINWISGEVPKLPIIIKAKIRYQHKPALAAISKMQDAHCSRTAKYRIQFKKLQRAITPGQSVVFYKNNEVLGGGIICQNV